MHTVIGVPLLCFQFFIYRRLFRKREIIVAERLAPEFKLDRFRVLRRIKRMNKRLEAEMGKPIAESRDHKWVLTRYVQRICGASKQEVEAGDVEVSEK